MKNTIKGMNLQLCAEQPQFTNFNDPALQAKVAEIMNQNNPQENVDNGGQVMTSSSTTGNPAEVQSQEQIPPEVQQVPQGQEQLPQGQVAPQEATQAQLILGKFKSPDEVINAYQNLESFNTKTRQELADTKNQLNAVMQKVEQLEKNPVGQPQSMEAEPQYNDEETLNNFYDSPTKTIAQLVQSEVNKILEQTIKPTIEPIQAKMEAEQAAADWNNRVNEFAQGKPDFNDHIQSMQQILAEMPEMSSHPRGLEIVYGMAKGMNQPQAAEPQITDDVKKGIIDEYLKSVKATNDKSPITINSNAAATNGEMPFTVDNKPTTLEEASSIFRKMMGVN